MTFLASGMLSSLPFLAADFGNLGGGCVLAGPGESGAEPATARLRVMAACSLLISSGALVGLIREDWLAIVLLGLMALGTAAFMANYFAFCQEVSARHTGLVVGILGGLGNLFVAGFLPIAGRVKDVTGRSAAIFLIVGLLPFVGLGSVAGRLASRTRTRRKRARRARRFCHALKRIRLSGGIPSPERSQWIADRVSLHPGPHMRW